MVCDHSYCDCPRCCCSNQGDNLKFLLVLPFENQKQNITQYIIIIVTDYYNDPQPGGYGTVCDCDDTCLEKVHVGVTPGIDFGPGGEGFLRFSYANSIENIEEGLNRLEKYLKEYH